MKMIPFLVWQFWTTETFLTAINTKKYIVSKIYNLVTVIMENKEVNTYRRCILEMIYSRPTLGLSLLFTKEMK